MIAVANALSQADRIRGESRALQARLRQRLEQHADRDEVQRIVAALAVVRQLQRLETKGATSCVSATA